MSDETTYENPQDDEVLDVNPEAGTDTVMPAGRYGLEGEAELFDIQKRDIMRDGAPLTDRNGVPYTYMDLAVRITRDPSQPPDFVHSSPFAGRNNTRIEAGTGSAWPRFANALRIAGRRKSEVLPMKVVVDVSLDEWFEKLNPQDPRPANEMSETERVLRRTNRLVNILPFVEH